VSNGRQKTQLDASLISRREKSLLHPTARTWGWLFVGSTPPKLGFLLSPLTLLKSANATLAAITLPSRCFSLLALLCFALLFLIFLFFSLFFFPSNNCRSPPKGFFPVDVGFRRQMRGLDPFLKEEEENLESNPKSEPEATEDEEGKEQEEEGEEAGEPNTFKSPEEAQEEETEEERQIRSLSRFLKALKSHIAAREQGDNLASSPSPFVLPHTAQEERDQTEQAWTSAFQNFLDQIPQDVTSSEESSRSPRNFRIYEDSDSEESAADAGPSEPKESFLTPKTSKKSTPLKSYRGRIPLSPFAKYEAAIDSLFQKLSRHCEVSNISFFRPYSTHRSRSLLPSLYFEIKFGTRCNETRFDPSFFFLCLTLQIHPAPKAPSPCPFKECSPRYEPIRVDQSRWAILGLDCRKGSSSLCHRKHPARRLQQVHNLQRGNPKKNLGSQCVPIDHLWMWRFS